MGWGRHRRPCPFVCDRHCPSEGADFQAPENPALRGPLACASHPADEWPLQRTRQTIFSPIHATIFHDTPPAGAHLNLAHLQATTKRPRQSVCHFALETHAAMRHAPATKQSILQRARHPPACPAFDVLVWCLAATSSPEHHSLRHHHHGMAALLFREPVINLAAW